MSAWIEALRRLFVTGTETSTTVETRPALEDDAARCTLAQVLRAYGQEAIDLDDRPAIETTATFQRMARELAASGAPPRWDTLVEEFTRHRRFERRSVEARQIALRDTLWSVLARVGRSVVDDRQAETMLGTQVGRLKAAVTRGSVEELRREVLTVAETIGDVIAERRSRQERQLAALGAELSQMRQQLQQARQSMQTDALTKLFNRAAFDEQIDRIAALNLISGEPACLLMVDVDHFKAVNDRHGHTVGDAALRQIADSLIRTFPRRSDFVARYGGEEFAVILAQDDAITGRALAERLLATVRAGRLETSTGELTLTVSVGVAALHAGEEPLDWVKRADGALYAAKAAGRDRMNVAVEIESPVG